MEPTSQGIPDRKLEIAYAGIRLPIELQHALISEPTRRDRLRALAGILPGNRRLRCAAAGGQGEHGEQSCQSQDEHGISNARRIHLTLRFSSIETRKN